MPLQIFHGAVGGVLLGGVCFSKNVVDVALQELDALQRQPALPQLRNQPTALGSVRLARWRLRQIIVNRAVGLHIQRHVLVFVFALRAWRIHLHPLVCVAGQRLVAGLALGGCLAPEDLAFGIVVRHRGFEVVNKRAGVLRLQDDVEGSLGARRVVLGVLHQLSASNEGVDLPGASPFVSTTSRAHNAKPRTRLFLPLLHRVPPVKVAHILQG
jgi:hypothetical protein